VYVRPSRAADALPLGWSVGSDRQDFFRNPGGINRGLARSSGVVACLVVIGITVFPALLFAWFVLIEPRVQQRIMQRSRRR
jgi:hypothetical protein